ncbi:MAG: hypothetical protein AAFX52_11125 [Pseudomonadota bacterium]
MIRVSDVYDPENERRFRDEMRREFERRPVQPAPTYPVRQSLIDGGGVLQPGYGGSVAYADLITNPLAYSPQATVEFAGTTGGAFILSWRVNVDDLDVLIPSSGGDGWNTFVLERPDGSYKVLSTEFSDSIVRMIRLEPDNATTVGTYKLHFYRDADFDLVEMQGLVL